MLGWCRPAQIVSRLGASCAERHDPRREEHCPWQGSRSRPVVVQSRGAAHWSRDAKRARAGPTAGRQPRRVLCGVADTMPGRVSCAVGTTGARGTVHCAAFRSVALKASAGAGVGACACPMSAVWIQRRGGRRFWGRCGRSGPAGAPGRGDSAHFLPSRAARPVVRSRPVSPRPGRHPEEEHHAAARDAPRPCGADNRSSAPARHEQPRRSAGIRAP